MKLWDVPRYGCNVLVRGMTSKHRSLLYTDRYTFISAILVGLGSTTSGIPINLKYAP